MSALHPPLGRPPCLFSGQAIQDIRVDQKFLGNSSADVAGYADRTEKIRVICRYRAGKFGIVAFVAAIPN
ncbi:MAG: hypothetical protein D6755_07730, partial [Anaerolineae bacterium]